MGKVRLKTSKMKLVAQDKDIYVSRHVTFSRIPTEELIQHASRASGIPEPIMGASFAAIATQVEELLMNGHSISLGNIGTMRMGVSCKAAKTAEDVSSTNVRVRRILVTPSVSLKAKLNQVNIETENPFVKPADAENGGEGDDDELA
jgi:predicted histone-like DNA-binding protein